jgi:hypothetical protein
MAVMALWAGRLHAESDSVLTHRACLLTVLSCLSHTKQQRSHSIYLYVSCTIISVTWFGFIANCVRKFFSISPMFCNKGLTAALSQIDLCVVDHSTSVPV